MDERIPSLQDAIASKVLCGSSFTDDGLELWSSKELNLLPLPRCDNWLCPSLHAIVDLHQTRTQHDVEYEWFWKVDHTFAAWATRTIHRATRAKADLLGGVKAAFSIVREYVEGFRISTWSEVERLAALGPVMLNPIDDSAHYHALVGWCPKWGRPASDKVRASGWYAWYERYYAEYMAASPDTPTPPTRTHRTRQRQTGRELF